MKVHKKEIEGSYCILYDDDMSNYESKYKERHMKIVMHLFDKDRYVLSIIGKQQKKIHSRNMYADMRDGRMLVICSAEKEWLTLDDFNKFKDKLLLYESSLSVLRLAYVKELNLTLHQVNMFVKNKRLKLTTMVDYASQPLRKG